MDIASIKIIQSFSNPILDFVFTAITMAGEELFIALICAAIYWIYDKNFGKMLIFTIFLSTLVNGVVKDFVKAARPSANENIRILRPQTATGYSFPSGHTQNAATAYSFIAFHFRKRWLSLLIYLLCILVAVSRIYLGVHFPRDVIGGFVIGLVVSVISFYFLSKIRNKSYVFIGVSVLFSLFLFFNPSVDFIKSLGSIYGFTFGVLFEERFVNFDTKINFKSKILRLVVGLFLLLFMEICLKLLFPQLLIYDFVRYFIIIFTAVGLYPLTFKFLTKK